MVHYIPVSPGQLRMSELRLINSVAGLLTQTEEDKLKAADTGGSEGGGGGTEQHMPLHWLKGSSRNDSDGEDSREGPEGKTFSFIRSRTIGIESESSPSHSSSEGSGRVKLDRRQSSVREKVVPVVEEEKTGKDGL
jgi:hypothetical protein